MTIDPEISKYVAVGYLKGISKIKEGTPQDMIIRINEINELYKKSFGKYLWNFKK